VDPGGGDGLEDATVPKRGGDGRAAVTIESTTRFSGAEVTTMVVEAVGEVGAWSQRWRRNRTMQVLGRDDGMEAVDMYTSLLEYGW
jgi:hypothetical protein